MKKVLVANRGEIAIRVFRACSELGIKTVAVYSYEDRYSLHRYKADEAYQIGPDGESIKPYLNSMEIIRLAKKIGVDGIHPGYGFLSENKDFVRACEENKIKFIGPNSDVIFKLGNKIEAKKIAEKLNVPTIQGAEVSDITEAEKLCNKINYPVMLKAASGGGGRGMRVLHNSDDLHSQFPIAKRESLNAFGDDQLFIEKYIANPKHIEVQILADEHGNVVHLFERDCSVQRRFQKVIESAPAVTLSSAVKQRLFRYALQLANEVKYQNAGTVEFLVEEEDIYFIEVNPRIQVEHTVTETITGIDLVRAQILIADGLPLSDPKINILNQSQINMNGYAIQCRITTEDPQNDFKPDYGKIIHYRTAAGFGLRLDEGNIYNGAIISPFFDSMLLKVTSWGLTHQDACDKMFRAMIEFRVRGVKTNVQFLENVMLNPEFRKGNASVHFIKNHPELFSFPKRKDRGTKILRYIANVTVNGNPDVKIRDNQRSFFKVSVPDYDKYADFPKGSKNYLEKHGPTALVKWLKEQKKVQFTDTTFRDAHQSLLATRLRSYDMLKVAESFAKNHPQIFSMEVWGGATFDVAYRFLYEDPWERLRKIRQAVPNILLQMLLRGSNAVGYTSYPNNLIERFIIRSAEEGIDIFRIFDSLNWTKGMELSLATVRKSTQAIAEPCICYTNDILDSKNKKYNLAYYLQLAKDLENMGAHILGIKDMAGLLKPYAAELLISELKQCVQIPIHLHTHDTSSIQAATYMKAVEAGVDVIDCALAALSGLTSQPNLNSMLELLKHTKYDCNFDIANLNEFSEYWENIREIYYPFESGLKAGAADVYYHEIPGGQYSNLKPQAISLGLGDRMQEIKKAYHDVNQLFGDIVKVTPSSKVVGDLALYLVANGYSVDDVMEKGEQFPFPESVVEFFEGRLGQPVGGFPKKLQTIILKGRKAFKDEPGNHLALIDFESEIDAFKHEFGSELTDLDFLSYKLYPKVFKDYLVNKNLYGDVSILPSEIFFFGMKKNSETLIEIAPGKTIIVNLISVSSPDKDGIRRVFFELNGQGRIMTVKDNSISVESKINLKANPSNKMEIASPLPGRLSKISVKQGQSVKKGDTLFIIEAMKMETNVTAQETCKIAHIELEEAAIVDSGDLIIRCE